MNIDSSFNWYSLAIKPKCKECGSSVVMVKFAIGSLTFYLCNPCMLDLYKDLDMLPYTVQYNLVE